VLTVSDAYKALSLAGPSVSVKVEYQTPGSDTWVSLLVPGLRELEDGTVTCDRQSLVRRTATITLGGRDAIPTSLSSPTSPLNRYRLYRGVNLRPGQVEWLRLGTFVVTGYTKNRPSGRFDLDLSDYMHALNSDRLIVPVETAEDGVILDYIKRLLNTSSTDIPDIVPDNVQPAFPGATLRIDPAVDQGAILDGEAPVFDESRGDAIDYLARLMNAQLRADTDGGFELVPLEVNGDGAAVFTFRAGDGGTYADLRESGGFDDFANIVAIRNGDYVMEASITEGPLAVRDGFTYRYVEDVSSEEWDEVATERYAQRVIAERLGLAETTSASVLCLPWLEDADIVEVVDPDTGLITTRIIDTITHPLAGASASMSTRALRLTAGIPTGRTQPDVFTPRPTDPVLSYVASGTETLTMLTPQDGEIAVLAVRGDATTISGVFDVWTKVLDGGVGAVAESDTVDLYIGTGLGAGTTLTVSGGTGSGRVAVAVWGNVRGDVYLADASDASTPSVVTELVAPGLLPQRGDIVVCAMRAEGGLIPGVDSGWVDLGFAGVHTRAVSGTTHGIGLSTGLAGADTVGTTFTASGAAGAGQAVNVLIRGVS
jgi:hypothetical protein